MPDTATAVLTLTLTILPTLHVDTDYLDTVYGPSPSDCWEVTMISDQALCILTEEGHKRGLDINCAQVQPCDDQEITPTTPVIPIETPAPVPKKNS